MYRNLLIFLFFTSLVSCKEEDVIKPEPKWDNNNSVALQQDLAQEEAINIKLFLASHRSWKMEQTGTGLQYYIYEGKEGSVMAKTGDKVEVAFEIKDLSGELYYKISEVESRIFTFEKSDVETGIQELIKLMPVGGKTHAIVPAHLAHGLLGDNAKIPPLTCLWIDLEFVSIIKK
jgi:FKBP-type peptidyl-prolyl cis-trans isomerase